jgi:ligand-binding SRPBCC domain-containing protein
MSIITVISRIHAPIEECFDLARDIDLHIESTTGTNEKAIAGVTTGLIGLGQEVTWEATHLGVRQTLTSRITAFDRPRHFRDSQVRGPFRRFDHDHHFATEAGITVMKDVFDYAAPLGWLGQCVDRLFLQSYLAKFLQTRSAAIKEAADAGRGRSLFLRG